MNTDSPEIAPEDLARQLASSPPVVVDVREDWEVRLAPFPNALHIPLGELPDRAATELTPTSPIVTVCHHGVRSMHALLMLKGQGFTHVQSLRGGTDLWSRTVDPSLRRY